MERVLARRDENWKKLQQYVLDERETLDLTGPGGARLYGFRRDYSWFMRDGIFVRSPLGPTASPSPSPRAAGPKPTGSNASGAANSAAPSAPGKPPEIPPTPPRIPRSADPRSAQSAADPSVAIRG